MPSGTPMSTISSRAVPEICAVTGRRWPMRLVTDWWAEYETPRSPCTTLLAQAAYCTGHGWSSASSCLTAATISGPASTPACSWDGSPGAKRSSTNATIDTHNSTGTASASLDKISRSTSGRLEWRRGAVSFGRHGGKNSGNQRVALGEALRALRFSWLVAVQLVSVQPAATLQGYLKNAQPLAQHVHLGGKFQHHAEHTVDVRIRK